MDSKTPGEGMAPEDDGKRRIRRRRRRRGFAMSAVSLCILLLFLAGGLLIGGFLRFAEQVAALEVPPNLEQTDAIVVLTGGSQRIDRAVDLFNDGVGRRLLISGVNPRTSGAQIKSMTTGSDDLFDCCVDIGHDAIDTIGNANETARWIADNGFERVLIVTNNYHVPRSLLELRRADPSTEFAAFPVTLADLKAENWLAEPEVMRVMVEEYGKYTWARLRPMTGTTTASGLRTDRLPGDAGTVVRAGSQ